MSDGVTFTVIGDKSLLRTLDRIAKKDARSAIRKGTRAGAKIVTSRTKQLAPVSGKRFGPFKKTRRLNKRRKIGGTLRRSIRSRSAKRSRNFIGAVTVMGAGFFKGDTFYGAFQEFGWKTGKRKSQGRKQIEGKHFMERAAKQVGRKAMRVATDIIARMIERSGGRSG